MESPLVVHGDILRLSTCDSIVMLHNAQSVVEQKALIFNVIDLFLSRILVNYGSGKDILLGVEEGRAVLGLLLESRSR